MRTTSLVDAHQVIKQCALLEQLSGGKYVRIKKLKKTS